MTILDRTIMQLSGAEGTVEFDVDPSKETIRMTVGKEKRSFKFGELYAMVFAIADEEKQSDMMPVRQTEVVTYRRIHNVMLKKDMKKGQKIRVSCEINVPQIVNEGLKGLVDKKNAKSFNFESGGIPIIGGSVTR
jgi:hypothetical protein